MARHVSGRGVLAATVLACAISACSSRQAPSVASLPGHSHHGATTHGTAGGFQQVVNFARCMRGHGVSVPDPQPGKPYAIPAGTGAAAALHACGHLLPPASISANGSQSGKIAAEMPALIDYARCMRGHDIAMLNPDSSGNLNLGNVPGVSGDFGRYSPQFRAADAACRHLLPAGVHDNGTGP
jgi:hypothetical protein